MQNDLKYIINPQGKLIGDLPQGGHELMLALYASMLRTRVFDLKAVSLQRTGQLGTYPSSLGQEGLFCAVGTAMDSQDIYVPYYRDHGAFLERGMSMSNLLRYWGGDEMGNCDSNAQRDFPISVPIATQVPHAVGAAAALKFRGEKQAVVVTCGDGATSKGDFLESLNLAGVWQLPVVFVVNNNGWAISVPLHLQTRLTHLSDKSLAAGFESVRVDGGDALAVHGVVREACEKARSGGGPTLVEAITQRLSDHTTADDASRYRTAEDLKQAWMGEPVKRLRDYLTDQNIWDEKKELALQLACEKEVALAVEEYKNLGDLLPEDLYDHLYAELPYGHKVQRNELIARCFLKDQKLDGWGDCDE
jgi:2-oxoisovalerate dehydrogenase E1 component alpha subunit